MSDLTTKLVICDRICQKGLVRAIINIEKCCFEILNTVYLEHAWSLVYEILHQSIVRSLQIDFLFPVLAKQNLACGRAVNSIIPLC